MRKGVCRKQHAQYMMYPFARAESVNVINRKCCYNTIADFHNLANAFNHCARFLIITVLIYTHSKRIYIMNALHFIFISLLFNMVCFVHIVCVCCVPNANIEANLGCDVVCSLLYGTYKQS